MRMRVLPDVGTSGPHAKTCPALAAEREATRFSRDHSMPPWRICHIAALVTATVECGALSKGLHRGVIDKVSG
jgi:hypothetical protein